ncbi:hypothetical protein R3P38DRAFT_2809437 [Favolaschia claudopus]|uniref:Uncharacterized protein n=1 Tax=Favolaschia claudopus TaxID=2862362 RepID=A0AAV9ZD33_9AGAR
MTHTANHLQLLSRIIRVTGRGQIARIHRNFVGWGFDGVTENMLFSDVLSSPFSPEFWPPAGKPRPQRAKQQIPPLFLDARVVVAVAGAPRSGAITLTPPLHDVSTSRNWDFNEFERCPPTLALLPPSPPGAHSVKYMYLLPVSGTPSGSLFASLLLSFEALFSGVLAAGRLAPPPTCQAASFTAALEVWRRHWWPTAPHSGAIALTPPIAVRRLFRFRISPLRGRERLHHAPKMKVRYSCLRRATPQAGIQVEIFLPAARAPSSSTTPTRSFEKFEISRSRERASGIQFFFFPLRGPHSQVITAKTLKIVKSTKTKNFSSLRGSLGRFFLPLRGAVRNFKFIQRASHLQVSRSRSSCGGNLHRDFKFYEFHADLELPRVVCPGNSEIHSVD